MIIKLDKNKTKLILILENWLNAEDINPGPPLGFVEFYELLAIMSVPLYET